MRGDSSCGSYDRVSRARVAWIVIAICCVSIPQDFAVELFGPASSSFPTGSQPSSLVVRDFNGDGAADVAVANEFASTVDVLLGDGFGGLVPTSTTDVGLDPADIAAGDFDRDGFFDLVTADFSATAVTILFGDGQGGFRPLTGPAVEPGSSAVATGDLDGDGALDLILASVTGKLRIFMGDGRGGFPRASEVDVGAIPLDVAVADLNGDGALDLAAACFGPDTVSVLLGDGDGGFPDGAVDHGAGLDPRAVVVADLDRDGAPDLAVANQSGASVSVLRGDGTGAFAPASEIDVQVLPISIAAGDLDADGAPDLAVVNNISDSVSVLLGDGVGGFTRSDTSVGGALAVAVADFDSDGAVDLAVTGTGRLVNILRGDGTGRFSDAPRVRVQGAPRSIAVIELNGDGLDDVAIARTAADKVTLLLGDGLGGLAPASEFAVGEFPVAVVPADFDGDGIDDLAVNYIKNDPFTDFVGIWLGDGRGGFTAAVDTMVGGVGEATSPDNYPGDSKVAVSDLNGDGLVDLAVATRTSVDVLIGNGRGGLEPGAEIDLGPVTSAVVAADFNGDGASDLAAASSASGVERVRVFLNDGRGAFRLAGQVDVAEDPISLAVGRFGEDDIVDLAVGSGDERSVSIFRGDGSGGFFQTGEAGFGERPRAIAVTDHNKDGLEDLAVADHGGVLHILLSDGSGGLRSGGNLEMGNSLRSVDVVELDGNDAADLIVTDSTGEQIVIAYNQLDARSDLDASNRIDGFDLARIGQRMGSVVDQADFRRNVDVDLNGTIDGFDCALVASRFGKLNRSASPLRAVADEPPLPDPDTVGLRAVPSEGDLLTVEVLVNDDDDAATAANFAVTFGADDGGLGEVLEVVGFEAGSYLSGGIAQFFSLDTATPGRVGIAALRLPDEDLPGNGMRPLMNLIFRSRRVGTATLGFAPFEESEPTLLDTEDETVDGVTFEGSLAVTVNPFGESLPGQKIGFFPGRLEFGDVDPGARVRQKLRISNFGFSDLRVPEIGVSHPEFSSFFSSAFSIPPFGFVRLVVEFSPERLGFFSADLVISSDDPQRLETFVPLIGRSDGAFGVTPERLDFDLVPVGSGRSEVVRLANRSSETLFLNGFQSSDPRFVPSVGFQQIPSGETAEIEVQFQPTGNQKVRAALTLTFDGPEERPVVIGLSGEGDPDTDGDGIPDRLDACPTTPDPCK